MEMSSFFDEQGRTRVSTKAYIEYVAGGKPAENTAHREKGHIRGARYDTLGTFHSVLG